MKIFTASLVLELLLAFTLSATLPPPLMTFSSGMYNTRSKMCPLFQIEYKSELRLHRAIVPFGGLLMTTKASTYFYGGFGIEFPYKNRFSIIPSFAAGFYAAGRGKNLHYPLEFRTAIECAYIFCNQSRLGFQLAHLSNAGISKHNPGVEYVLLCYSHPFYWD